jgi:hypothetical protein
MARAQEEQKMKIWSFSSPAQRRFSYICACIALVLACTTTAQDDLADYPIKEEQCENFGECLTECVKKLPPNRQFTEIVSSLTVGNRHRQYFLLIF